MDGVVMQDALALFKGKRVVVTGDTGFKGSWLSLWLHGLGAKVLGYALPPKHDSDHFKLLSLREYIKHIDGDVRDITKLRTAISDFKPEFVFHLAAQAIVRLSYDEPKDTFDTNIGGSVNILEVIRNTPSVKSVIYVTSDKCYKNKEWHWGYRENDELGGHDPYSASKAAAEVVFSAYVDSFFSKRSDIGISSVRAGNVVGGGDWSADRIVPDCVRSLQKNESIVIRNPHATRPWQHVLEPLSGYLLMAANLYINPKCFSGSWNFGPDGRAIRTVKDLADKVVSCWGSGSVQVVEQKGAPHESGLLHLNCDKSHQILNWHPRWDFDRTVSETVRWYKEISLGKNAMDISKQQIADYLEV